MSDPMEDLALLEGWPLRKIVTHDPVSEARVRNWKRKAAERLSGLMSRYRITMPITSHFDWERLRVNVAHLVAPKIVRWS